MSEVIFWGAGGQAKVLRDCLDEATRLIALFDKDLEQTSPFSDVPLIGGRADFERWLAGRSDREKPGFLVAVGGDKGKDRLQIHQYLESCGLIAVSAIHRTAFVASDVRIGSGSQILAQSAVCVQVTIGRSCIVNTSASVDHDSHLDDGVHIAPGARLLGCVQVNKYAMIGAGAIVLPRITIGEGAIVGAGAVVLKDVEPHTVVAGNPARVLRTCL